MRPSPSITSVLLVAALLGPLTLGPSAAAPRRSARPPRNQAAPAPPRSLVTNGTFDRDTLGWTSFVQPPATGRADRAPDGGRGGGGALHLVALPGGGRQVVAWNCRIESLPVGHRMRVAAWLKGSGCRRPPAVSLTVRGESGAVAFMNADDTFKPGVDFDWSRAELAVAIPSTSRYALLSVVLTGPGEVWIDDVTAIAAETLAVARRPAH